MATTRPDVLLLDLTFPEGDGLPLLRALRTRYPDLRVIILTMDRGSESVRQALVAGASGYVVKGARSRDLFEAIRAVWRGERYLHSSITGAIVDDSIRLTRTGQDLSMREREILSLLASGRTPSEVGRMLGISVHTVRRHVANLSAKLGLRGIGALTVYAIAHGLDPGGVTARPTARRPGGLRRGPQPVRRVSGSPGRGSRRDRSARAIASPRRR